MTTSWTPVPKPLPTSSVITNVYTGGDPIGLLLALTYSQVSTGSVITGIWTPISNNSTSWTDVPKGN
jgi:hypothetical protein